MKVMKPVLRAGGGLLLGACLLGAMSTASAQDKPSLAGFKYQYKVGVLPFVDNTGSGGQDMGTALSRAVQAEIAHSSDLEGRVLKLDEGTNPEDVDSERAVEIGRARKVDVVLIGTVLEASSEESEKSARTPSIFGQSVGGSARSVKATVTLQGDLYDVATGKKIDSIRVTGKASDTKVGADISTSLGDLSSGGASFQNSPIGKALHSAVADLVKRLAADESKMTRYQPSADAGPPSPPSGGESPPVANNPQAQAPAPAAPAPAPAAPAPEAVAQPAPAPAAPQTSSAVAACPAPTGTFGTREKTEVSMEGRIYFLPADTEKLPEFPGLKSEGSIYTAKWDVPSRDFTEGFPGVTNRFEWFALDYQGPIYVAKAGEYRFHIGSDDGAILYLDGRKVIDDDGVHDWVESDGNVELSRGTHPFRLSYFQGPQTRLGLQLWVTPPGESEKIFTLQDFSEEVAENRSQLGVTEDANEIRVKFGSEILFDTGKYDLKASAEKSLTQLAQLIRSYPGYPLIIEGHTDSVGKPEDNQTLSDHRALSVKTWLVTEGGIPDGCITTKGYGQTQPVASNDTAEGRQKNRRVEVRLLKPAPSTTGQGDFCLSGCFKRPQHEEEGAEQ